MDSLKPVVNNPIILSMSLSQSRAKELSDLQKKLGFSNRSKLLRAGVDALLQEYAALDSLSGTQKAVFVVSHARHHNNDFDDILHEYDDTVQTSLHQQSVDTCVQVLMAHGNAKRLRTLFSELKKAKGVKQVSVFVL